jgi:hypothetical protein
MKTMTVKEANDRAEMDMTGPFYHCKYWRTDSGNVRKTGWIASTDDGRVQLWAKTKKDAINRLEEYGK